MLLGMDGNQKERNTYDVGIYKRIIYRWYAMDISCIINLYNTNNICVIYDSCNDRLGNVKHKT